MAIIWGEKKMNDENKMGDREIGDVGTDVGMGNLSEKVETEDMWCWRKAGKNNMKKMREEAGEMCMSHQERTREGGGRRGEERYM